MRENIFVIMVTLVSSIGAYYFFKRKEEQRN